MKSQEKELIQFGARLRKLRIDQGKTQLDLAVAIEGYPNYISKLENGHAEPGLLILIALAQALNCKVGDLVD